jgi:hypothetical protein
MKAAMATTKSGASIKVRSGHSVTATCSRFETATITAKNARATQESSRSAHLTTASKTGDRPAASGSHRPIVVGGESGALEIRDRLRVLAGAQRHIAEIEAHRGIAWAPAQTRVIETFRRQHALDQDTAAAKPGDVLRDLEITEPEPSIRGR